MHKHSIISIIALTALPAISFAAAGEGSGTETDPLQGGSGNTRPTITSSVPADLYINSTAGNGYKLGESITINSLTQLDSSTNGILLVNGGGSQWNSYVLTIDANSTSEKTAVDVNNWSQVYNKVSVTNSLSSDALITLDMGSAFKVYTNSTTTTQGQGFDLSNINAKITATDVMIGCSTLNKAAEFNVNSGATVELAANADTGTITLGLENGSTGKGNINVNAGSLTLTGNKFQQNDGTSITVKNSGNLTFSTATTNLGNATVAGNLTLGGTTFTQNAYTTLSVTGNLIVSATTANLGDTTVTNGDMTISGGTTAILNGTLNLSGANTIRSINVLDGGTLKLGNAAVTSTGNNRLILKGNATLVVDGSEDKADAVQISNLVITGNKKNIMNINADTYIEKMTISGGKLDVNLDDSSLLEIEFLDRYNAASMSIYNFKEGQNTVKIYGLSDDFTLDLISVYINGTKFDGPLFLINDTLTTVPEPAEWAVILGSIALGLAIYRRRK